MKVLILLQGIPGSGKSTFIKEKHLEDFTLSSDEIRKQLGGVFLSLEGYSIDQSTTKEAFELLHQMLEARMKKGCLTIVDATHTKEKDIQSYNKLCKEYGYRKYIVRFDCDVETAIKRDAERGTKCVGEKVIRRHYDNLSKLSFASSWNIVKPEELNNILTWKEDDVNQYKHVNIFGDIHGCMKPLKEFFSKYPISKEELYVFTGDLIDRGPENNEVLKFVLGFKGNNVIYCEGNHELHLRRYVRGEEPVSKDFEKTMEDISDIDVKEIREFVRGLRQAYCFNFRGHSYFVNHGGLPCMPEYMVKIPTIQLIKGVGNYDTLIDDYYESNYNGVTQIHGHRNVLLNDGTEHSINLEGGIERGGMLKVWRDGEIIKIDNPITSSDFKNSPLIGTKTLKSGICSYNFTREAFQTKQWNNLTTTARGLFMDGDIVVARGYNKFFNIGENEETSWNELLKKEGEVTCYLKENGFLGLLSYYNNDIHFHSKSTDEGAFAGYFKRIFYELPIRHEAVKEWLKNNNYTLTFEVIDVHNDPHIVEYDNDRLVLLDAIKNDLSFERLPYDELVELSKLFHCEVKQVKAKFSSFAELKKWLETYRIQGEEGVVAECGDYMCKVKTEWYRKWKQHRTERDRMQKNLPVENNSFTEWLKKHPELLELSIIELRNKYPS